jgi:phosphate/sulfate permease
MGIAILIYLIIIRFERSISLPSASWVNRFILFGAVFYVAYAFGANNVGMILSFVLHANASIASTTQVLEIETAIYFGIALGTVLFGKAIAKVVGDKIVGLSQIKTLSAMLGAAFVTWLFTQFALPVSLTQVVIGGMLGAGTARGPTIINRSEILSMVGHWVLVTLLCTGIGFLTEYLFLHH